MGGRINGRCHLIPILLRKLWRFTFPVRLTLWIHYSFILITSQSSYKTHEHLDLLVDKRLAFDRHVEEMILKDNKGIGLITKLRRYLRKNYLLTIYKVFIRSHLDYGDVVYPGKASFMQKYESVQ